MSGCIQVSAGHGDLLNDRKCSGKKSIRSTKHIAGDDINTVAMLDGVTQVISIEEKTIGIQP